MLFSNFLTSLKAQKKFFVFTKKTRTTFVTCLFAAQSVFAVCVLARLVRLVVPVMMFLPLLNSPFFFLLASSEFGQHIGILLGEE